VLPVAGAAYAAVFTAFLLWETPGLGTGHFFYVPVCLVALVSDELLGMLAGVFASGLYLAAIEITPRVPSTQALTTATAIRLVTYSLVGGLVGFYASRNRRLVERLRENAGRDFLTGLGNARLFDEELARRCAGTAPFALVLADVDELKEVNDVHGHAAGNAALRRVGEVLRQHADAEDFIARIGGDEFAIVTELPHDQIAALTTRVNRTLSTESLSVTFGVTHRPDDGETAAELFHKADDRLFAAQLVRQNRATVVALAKSS
jgi:diguanylate cyclase (GGDEF)-like protein